jgi:hypothetical protein
MIICEHFWQVWLISVQRFQRRRFKCEKLTDGRTDDGRLKNTHLTILNLNMYMYCWFLFIVSALTLYIINKNYQWILTFWLLKYLLPLTMNRNQQYMYMLRFNIVRCVFLLFYVLMKHIILCVNIALQ